MVRSTRDDILAVAATMFAATGFKGTSLHDLAVGVGCSKATLLYHFDGKDAILAELIGPAVEALRALDKEISDLPADAARRAAVEGFVTLALRFRREILVIYGDFPELLRQPTFQDLQRFTDRLVAAFAGRSTRAVDRVAALVVLAGVPAAAVESPDVADDDLRAELTATALRALRTET